MKITIGTRGSQLSLAQTEIIKNQLISLNKNLDITIKTITTQGDVTMMPIPLDTVGKGWFTKEIDKALLDGDIDMAVHSLKDLPEVLPKGLVIAATPEREDARDVLVSRDSIPFEKLPKGAIIGTDSVRRKIQLLHKRPDLIVQSIRGNVNTRLEKLESGTYDAIMLAAAGLKRLQFTDQITEYFAIEDIIPSPGQGTLAIVIKEDFLVEFKNFCTLLNHTPTVIATTAERAFSQAVGGGCKTPTGAYAVCKQKTMTVYGMIGSSDGKHIVKEQIIGPIKESKQLGEQLAKTLLERI